LALVPSPRECPCSAPFRASQCPKHRPFLSAPSALRKFCASLALLLLIGYFRPRACSIEQLSCFGRKQAQITMTLIEIRARVPMTSPQHVYEIRPRKDHRGFDLISDACRLVHCGTPSRITRLGTRSFAAVHIRL